MGNKAPVQTDALKEKQFKAVGYDGSMPLGKKVFSIKLPIDIEQSLESMDTEARIALIRNAIITAVKNKQEQNVHFASGTDK